MTAPIRVRIDGRVARLSLSKPPHNILDRALNRALAAAVREHATNPEIAILVLDGGEARGFSAGVEVADHTPDKIEAMLADFHAAIRALWEAECVTVAALHGFALGGGLELAIACDLSIAEHGTRLGFPEIKLGCYPPVAAAMLPARVGWAMASELVLGGEELGVERAHALGLINRTCRPGALEAELALMIRPLLEKSPAVLREAKRALREGAASGAEDALARIERRYVGTLMKLEDATEGVQAFLEKREPRFRNR